MLMYQMQTKINQGNIIQSRTKGNKDTPDTEEFYSTKIFCSK